MIPSRILVFPFLLWFSPDARTFVNGFVPSANHKRYCLANRSPFLPQTSFNKLSSLCPPLHAESQNEEDTKPKKPSLFRKSAVPKELRKQIYEAEAKTKAAEGRRVRLTAFIILTLIGSLLGVSNGALTQLVESGGVNIADPDSGLAWTLSVPFLTTKWGGIVSLVAAGLFGTLAELEVSSCIFCVWSEFFDRSEAVHTAFAGGFDHVFHFLPVENS